MTANTAEKKRKAKARDATQEALQWCDHMIGQFIERNRQSRQWINVAEIVTWYLEQAGKPLPRSTDRIPVYEVIERDILDGRFERNGRSQLMFIHRYAERPRQKMTTATLSDAKFSLGEEMFRSEILDNLWVPRAVFTRWRKLHHLKEAPRFERRAASYKVEGKQKGRRGARSHRDAMRAQTC